MLFHNPTVKEPLMQIESQHHGMVWIGRDFLVPASLPWAVKPSTRPGSSKPDPTYP